MLLPSDVARLVLGYLQEEGLSATSQAFINESPNLKEYADHTIGDGTIPACVFSVFGKDLTTILNEYMSAKAKESSHEVPVLMTSLWKKLDFTLNQIKSLQNSPAISANQRIRSRVGVANMARQQTLTLTSAEGLICSSVSETNSVISPAHTSHSMLGHSTPVCYTGPHNRPALGSGTPQQIHDGNRLLNTPRDTPVQIIVSENRLNSGPMSPGRRKWDNPRKRSGALGGSSGAGRSATTAGSLNSEPQTEEVVNENFPQLVIQNARDKILGDRSLQEKLAENINKILANEPVPQTSKASSNTMDSEQSIDEILGLQGEIHMSDDAIHDILEQTESDPAFQALFDLFDYHKNRLTDGETGDGDISSSPEENDTAGPSSTVRPLQSDDPDAGNRDANASNTAPVMLKMRAGQERKTRKSTAPTLLKKTVLGPSGRASRIENSSARLLVTQENHQGVSSAAVDSNRKEKGTLSRDDADVTPMDTDEPLNTPPPSVDSLTTQEPATNDSTFTTPALSESFTVPSSRDSAEFAASEDTLASDVGKKQVYKRTQGCKEKPAAAPSSAVPVLLSPVQYQQNNTTNLPQTTVSSSKGDTLPVSTVSVAPGSSSAGVAVTTASLSSSASTSTTLTTTSASPASSSFAPVVATPSPSTGTPSKAAADSSDIMSLKIIISDNQDEDSSSDAALNKAIASISRPKIPTIYISSPAKSPAILGTPKANLDEAALAVSGLQRSEAHGSPLSCKAGAVISSPLTGTAQAQPSYVIQLPLDTATPAVQGATTSYFLLTEPPPTDVQTRQVLLPAGVSKGQSLPTNQYGVATPTLPTGFSTGSALILPSPMKSMMLPVSVVGQNSLGKVQMVSNQLVATPSPGPVKQTETNKTTSPSVVTRQSATAGTEKNLVGAVVQPAVADNTGQQDAAKGPSHRRILYFDSSREVQPQTSRTSTSAAPNASTSQSVQQAVKDKQPITQTKPAILGGNKPKRRIETVRCTVDPKTGVSLVKDSNPIQQQQKDPVRRNSRKQQHDIHNKEPRSTDTSSVDASQSKSESSRRSKSSNRKHSRDTHNDKAKAKDSRSSRSMSSDSAQKSGNRKDKEESGRKEPAENVPLKSREGRTEKRTPSQEMPNVTANKENEMKVRTKEQSTPSSSASRDFSPPAVTQAASNTQSKAAKAPSKTSSLAKQAAEMLQDMQGLNSPSTPVKKLGAGSSDVTLPGTGRNQEPPAEGPRTPSRQKKGKDGEGTPKHLLLHNTPDVPGCSPASEAGSENSINMAAHTLMILSRAAIARTGTPLKDSLRQEGVGEKSPTSSKNSKKRKQSSPTASPPAKKESKRSPSKMKDRERKKLIDCFPHDLDVDKFLSSLHYDE
ncbi:protein NPAT [Amphiprion ocellaris]|uniref:Protein NPAT C-terminal domain-containing protein n=1 Tax=Amphiprion ocellaris TaxID=80972 RepID=A0A3Q1CJH5_AMPOC|nr:protein NPAT [Amphiprion ocellaris]